jgi:hypothetical protein
MDKVLQLALLLPDVHRHVNSTAVMTVMMLKMLMRRKGMRRRPVMMKWIAVKYHLLTGRMSRMTDHTLGKDLNADVAAVVPEKGYQILSRARGSGSTTIG